MDSGHTRQPWAAGPQTGSEAESGETPHGSSGHSKAGKADPPSRGAAGPRTSLGWAGPAVGLGGSPVNQRPGAGTAPSSRRACARRALKFKSRQRLGRAVLHRHGHGPLHGGEGSACPAPLGWQLGRGRTVS